MKIVLRVTSEHADVLQDMTGRFDFTLGYRAMKRSKDVAVKSKLWKQQLEPESEYPPIDHKNCRVNTEHAVL